jgi:hypothetical protein
MNPSRRIKQVAWGLAAVLAVSTGVIGLLHAPFAKSALVAMGECPVKRVTAADVEAARVESVRKTRGKTPAKSKPALGFILEGSTPDDVRSWAVKNNVECKELREGLGFVCGDIPSSALPDRDATEGLITSLHLNFRPSDRKLVNLSLTSSNLTAESAVERMSRRAASLQAALGAPTKEAGALKVERFAQGKMATATVKHSYSDYEANVTATALEPSRVMLVEQYLSAND